jgi:hypothetical protein
MSSATTRAPASSSVDEIDGSRAASGVMFSRGPAWTPKLLRDVTHAPCKSTTTGPSPPESAYQIRVPSNDVIVCSFTRRQYRNVELAREQPAAA